MKNDLNNCILCPRNCGTDRFRGESGYCGAGKSMKIARAMLHQWEEPCISGERGSGTVFFSNCNMKCVFCQNHTISQGSVGIDVSISRLSEIFLELQLQGAHNINLVTPTHYVHHIVESIRIAKSKGLSLPIIYNSSGYENIETIKLLNGFIDVYLPDIKYFDNKYALRYSNAKDYFHHSSLAVEEMVSQVGKVEFDEAGIIKRGVIVRHLMLPGLLFDSKKIIDYIHSTFGNLVYVSIMNQYTPMNNAENYSEINKALKDQHYDSLIDYALSIGIKNGFIQDSGTSSKAFIPDFNLKGL